MEENKILWHKGNLMIGKRIGAWYFPNFHVVNMAQLPDSEKDGEYSWGLCFNLLHWWLVIGFRFNKKN